MKKTRILLGCLVAFGTTTKHLCIYSKKFMYITLWYFTNGHYYSLLTIDYNILVTTLVTHYSSIHFFCSIELATIKYIIFAVKEKFIYSLFNFIAQIYHQKKKKNEMCLRI